MLEIVQEDGRPSYFREKTRGFHELISTKEPTDNQKTSKPLNGHSAGGFVCDPEAAVAKYLGIAEEKLQPPPFTPISSRLDECGDTVIPQRQEREVETRQPYL